MEKLIKISRNDILRYMEIMQDAFDVVRLVDPEKQSVITVMQGKTFKVPNAPCYSVWEKKSRCENCVSMKSYIQEKRATKIEWFGNNSYSVVAIPYLVEDKYGMQKMVLELVNRISDELILAMDKSEATKTRLDYIKRMLYIDSLTDVYNRRYYEDRSFMDDLLVRRDQSLGILMIDIMDFRKLNEDLGRMKGDLVLQHVAAVMQEDIGDKGILMRVGGDEFLVLFPSITVEQMEMEMKQLKSHVSRYAGDGFLENHRIGINIGAAYVSRFNGQEKQLNKMVEQADQNMEKEKHR